MDFDPQLSDSEATDESHVIEYEESQLESGEIIQIELLDPVDSLNNNFESWTETTVGNVAYLILYSNDIGVRLKAQRLNKEFLEWYAAKQSSAGCVLL